jgi:hypothetical protein
MRTKIHFVGGEVASFDSGDSSIKMGQFGVEVVQSNGEEPLRVLFPWPRIKKVEQRGEEVVAVYHF